jgi:hypothetical protein
MKRTVETVVLVLMFSFVGGVYAGLVVRAARTHQAAAAQAID